MATVFTILFLATLGFWLARLIKPGVNKKTNQPYSRKQLSIGFSVFAVVLFVLIGITAPKQPPTSLQQQQTKLASKSAVQTKSVSQKPATDVKAEPTITTKQETETQPIPYTTTTRNDSSLAKGQTKVVQQGRNGVQTLTYSVTYSDSEQTSKALVSTTVTTAPTSKIVAVGTYIAPAPAVTTAPSTSCYPLTNGGNCYEPGEYCRNSDHGATGIAGDGKHISCEYNNGWRWED